MVTLAAALSRGPPAEGVWVQIAAASFVILNCILIRKRRKLHPRGKLPPPDIIAFYLRRKQKGEDTPVFSLNNTFKNKY
jgi:hypothetical protein